MTLGEITDTDKAMNPQHFGSDPAAIRINNPDYCRNANPRSLSFEVIDQLYSPTVDIITK